MGFARFNEQNYYEILEIEPGAAQNEIHLAYQRAKTTYSPESPALFTMFSESEARELLELIEEAFETLSNQNRRQQYDASLAGNLNTDTDTLPDLHPRSLQNQSSRALSAREKIPDGFARTKFSVYEVDEEIETEARLLQSVDGPFLQKIRLYKQVNLDQISEETRISKSYLAALENNDREALPAAVFVRGFVVQVARILGLDEQTTANAYMKQFNT